MINYYRIRKNLEQISSEIEIIKASLKKDDTQIINSQDLIRSIKYSTVVIAEAIANTLQHLLAKQFKVPASGYKEVLIKAKEHQIISAEMYGKLYPFIQFRNILIHQYWGVEDELFLKNLRNGIKDFQIFIVEIDGILDSIESKNSY